MEVTGERDAMETASTAPAAAVPEIVQETSDDDLKVHDQAVTLLTS
jgi:hypothetical protein